MKTFLQRKQVKEKRLFKMFFFLLPLLFITGVSFAQVKTISGRVIDDTDEPLVGVSVSVKNTTIGVLTDIDGKYSISIPSQNSILVFSFVGVKRQEIPVANQSVINVKLLSEANILDEVVVVGYTVQRKESLTGSLEAVDNKKLLDATTPNVENLLSGKATGVYVNQGSGQPGSEGKIIIRGRTTVNGSTDPLWVVDGVIVGAAANNLNPNDIESLTILKDAASTAIYGSQGANGVILVTTKKGQAGKSVVSFSARFAANKLNSGPLKVMDGAELYDVYAAGAGAGDGFKQNWTPALRDRNYDWWDNATQTGIAQDYTVSVSGGSDKIKTYFSLGLYDEEGAVKGFDFKKYTTLLKVDYQVFDWLKIKPQIMASLREVKNQQHSVTAMYSYLPWDSPYSDEGELLKGGKQKDARSNWVNTTGTNYMYDLQWNYSESKTYEVGGNFDFDVKLTDWLTFSSVNNYKYREYSNMTYVDPRSLGGAVSNGSIDEFKYAFNRVYTNQLLRFSKIIGPHIINAVAGYEWNEFNSKTTTGVGNSIPPEFIVNDVAIKPSRVRGLRQDWGVQSLLSNVNYDYGGKYLGQISFRRDGSSRFHKDHRYGNFFSVSGGWNIHNESFFKFKQINKLKLRASYGSVGNLPTNIYPQYTLYSVTTGYNEIPGALLSQVGNDEITWEKTYTTGVGLDARIFDRINLSFDYYYKNTSDLLYEVPLPGVIGISKIWRNVGAVQNKGFEATIGAEIIKRKDLQWNVEANIGVNNNKVKELYGTKQEIIVDDGTTISGSANKLLKPGYDIDTWYLPEWAGVDAQNGKPQWYTTDANGARVITNDYAKANQVVVGRYTPDFFGGFSTNVSYRNFDFSAIFNYSVGGQIYNYSRQEYDADGAYTDRNQMKLHSGWSRWEKEGDVATHPQVIYGNKTNSNRASSRYLETGTYLKLRNVSLSYNIAIPKLSITNLRISGSVENVFTISHFSGVDPEIAPFERTVGGVTSSNIAGVSTTVYPKVRRFVLGLNVTF